MIAIACAPSAAGRAILGAAGCGATSRLHLRRRGAAKLASAPGQGGGCG